MRGREGRIERGRDLKGEVEGKIRKDGERGREMKG